jgi:hypothetical protein
MATMSQGALTAILAVPVIHPSFDAISPLKDNSWRMSWV